MLSRVQAAAMALELNTAQINNVALQIEVLKRDGQRLVEAQPALVAELKAAQEEEKAAQPQPQAQPVA